MNRVYANFVVIVLTKYRKYTSTKDRVLEVDKPKEKILALSRKRVDKTKLLLQDEVITYMKELYYLNSKLINHKNKL